MEEETKMIGAYLTDEITLKRYRGVDSWNELTATIDEKLNADKFIVPGLGDFGDRYFGTE